MRSPLIRPELRVPAAAEPMARGVIEFLGGPRGRHGRGGLNAVRAIVAVAWVFLSFGFLSKANCAGGRLAEDGTVALNWDGNRQYTSFCYNDIVPLYSGRGLDQGGFPYAFSWVEGDLTRYMEYPVLAGLFQGVMGFVSRLTYPLAQWAQVPPAGWYFGLTALVMSIMWVFTIVLVTRLAGNRIWDSVLVAASPLVVIHAFTNWDIPSIFLVVAAMYAVTRNRPAVAGVLIGLGTAFKLWPLFILGAYLVLAVRNKRLQPLFLMLGSTLLTWVAVNLPVALMYPAAWGEFFRLNSTRSWEWTTIYAVLGRNTPLNVDTEVLNVFTLVGFVALCAAIGVFGLKVGRRPRVAEMVYLILAAFLLINKVWSPQYSLWLLVPAVLALPSWRLIMAWGLADAMVWPILMWHMLGTENKGVPGELLDVAIFARDGFIIAIAVLIIRQMLGKRVDKVSAAHQGLDPLAGPFAGDSDAASIDAASPAPHKPHGSEPKQVDEEVSSS